MNEEAKPVWLTIKTSGALHLNAALGRLRSAVWAEEHLKRLEERGLGDLFHHVTCPNCQSIIDLTGKPETPQVSCQFCNTISTITTHSDNGDEFEPQVDRNYCLCDKCGKYSNPKELGLFNFYFLVVVIGYRYRKIWMCPCCAREDALFNFLANLPFLLGIPPSLRELCRCYFPHEDIKLFKGLDRANRRAWKGDLDGAIAGYQKILFRRPISAGIRYNIGLALRTQERIADAVQMYESVLEDCSNFRPAAVALMTCYHELNESKKLAALKAQWSGGDDGPAIDSEVN
ncbi:tetratricopeptide repeat protein [Symmachiella macrocystis]|uniref:tetratricopeptide repeat protein n=1 Tax=Symmachiella macrocystis TaxID=2527985 RepID=UPI0011B6B04D|nr:tetratricopeptide repeat protein [Symmachiella macrocystis]